MSLRQNKNKSNDMEEMWKPIQGCEGAYQVSNYGNVRSWINNAKKIRSSPKILRQSNDARGYKLVCIKSKTRRVHRVVARAFIPNPENKPCINHIDGNKYNNHISNLEWCTYQENYDHGRDNGLLHNDYQKRRAKESNLGEKQPCSKLTKKDVVRIREKYAEGGIYHKDLAKEYGVSASAIGLIIQKKRWTHI